MSIRRQLLRRFGTILVIIAFILAAPYFLLPHYSFPPQQPFKGPVWYNPYQLVQPRDEQRRNGWVQANFHLHAKAWGGLTDGRNSLEHIDSVYRAMYYRVVALSNYFSIDTLPLRSRRDIRVPCYEHGYSIQKSHRLMIGARRVNWFDVLTPQTKHIKQCIMNMLRPDCEVLTLAHPAFGRPSYTMDDAAELCAYDCMEVLNHYRNSTVHWDAALSAGRPVWLVANDDSHNVDNDGETGVRWNWIYTDTTSPQAIYRALKSGCNVGYSGRHGNYDLALVYQSVNNDTLELKLAGSYKRSRFIGSGGRVLQSDSTSTVQREMSFLMPITTLRYALTRSDSYVRSEIESDSCTLYLNPIIRTTGSVPTLHAEINIWTTSLYAGVYLLGCLGSLYVAIRRRRGRVSLS